MIPTVVTTGPGKPAFEVFGFILTSLGELSDGIATVTQPGTGRWATVRCYTDDGGVTWKETPGTFSAAYAGLRDAERSMFQRSGFDNHATVPSAQSFPTTRHPNSFAGRG